jgi:hypothetical protein
MTPRKNGSVVHGISPASMASLIAYTARDDDLAEMWCLLEARWLAR